MNKKLLILLLTLAMAFVFAGCGSSGEEATDEGSGDQTQVLVFAAASMQSALEELEAAFEAENPDIDIVLNCDSSGTLMTQIEEGAPCDVFFSAAQAQMDELEGLGLVVDGTRQNVLNNQLVVVTYPDSGTKVKKLKSIGKAKSIALAASWKQRMIRRPSQHRRYPTRWVVLRSASRAMSARSWKRSRKVPVR